MLWGGNGPRREASALGLPRLQDEFGHVRGRYHPKQATTNAPRTSRCHSRSGPTESSSPTPAHDSTPISLMLAPFVWRTEARYPSRRLDTDSNLLFGVLALQADLLDNDRFA